MKSLPISIRLVVVAALLVVAGCATSTIKENRESELASAGFKAKTADTPEKQKHLQSLPDGKITMVQRDGKTFYIYPDKVHNVAYVGTPDEYEAYKGMRFSDRANNTDLQSADRNDPEARTNAHTDMLHDQDLEWNYWGKDFLQ